MSEDDDMEKAARAGLFEETSPGQFRLTEQGRALADGMTPLDEATETPATALSPPQLIARWRLLAGGFMEDERRQRAYTDGWCLALERCADELAQALGEKR